MTRIVVPRNSASAEADTRQPPAQEGKKDISPSTSDSENTEGSLQVDDGQRVTGPDLSAPFDFRGLSLEPASRDGNRSLTTPGASGLTGGFALGSELSKEFSKIEQADAAGVPPLGSPGKKWDPTIAQDVSGSKGVPSKSALPLPPSSQESSSRLPTESGASKPGPSSTKKGSTDGILAERRRGKEPKGQGGLHSVKTKRSSSRSPASSQGSSPRSRNGEAEESGYNSADEQLRARLGNAGQANDPEHEEMRERQFVADIKRKKGLEVHRILGDGNCLFRAMAYLVYGDVDMHNDVRQLCVDYMETNRDHYSQFVTENFAAYCKRKRRDRVYGNNLEIQALSEMYNRPIQVFCYGTEPMNIFHAAYATDNPPIRLSYHRSNHYNSLVDPRNTAVGVGLGFAHLRGRATDGDKVKQAIKAQQDAQLDQAVLAEGQWLSDMELTEAQMERSVREASRAEALSHLAGSTSHAASRQRQPEKTEKNAVEGGSIAGTRGEAPGCEGKSAGVTTNVRLLLNMGFDYMRVLEAASLFDDDFENILCFLLDPGAAGGGSEDGRHKGKAALS